VQSTLPVSNPGLQVPFKILQRRVCRKGGSSISQVLVEWSGMTEDLATWEDSEALRQHFPAADAWGQASSHGGGVVSDPLIDAHEAQGPRRRSSRTRQLPARLRD
jgi:hypothetical protein